MDNKWRVFKAFVKCSRINGFAYTNEIASCAGVTPQTASRLLLLLSINGELRMVEKKTGAGHRFTWFRNETKFANETVPAPEEKEVKNDQGEPKKEKGEAITN